MAARKLWWIALLTIGLITICVSVPAASMYATSSDNAKIDPHSSLNECIANFEQDDLFLVMQDCMLLVAKQSSAGGYAADMVAALATLRKQERIEESLCHAVAHELGHFEMERRNYDVTALLDDVPALPCTSGALHGALIAWGETQPDRESRETIAAMCRGLANGLPSPDLTLPYSDFYGMHYDCADGFGHAMWEASKGTPIEAIKKCTILDEDDLIEYCILGTGMQGAEFEFAGPSPPLTAQVAHATIAPWCTQEQGATRRGCAAMLAIPYAEELAALAWQNGKPVEPEELKEAAHTAIDRCAELAAQDMILACLTELTRRAMGQFNGQSSWMCPLMPRDHVRGCREIHASSTSGNSEDTKQL